ncbi:hypothetical protein Z043_116462, partial [Scleropages formosus]
QLGDDGRKGNKLSCVSLSESTVLYSTEKAQAKGMKVCLTTTLHHVDLAKASLTHELIQLMAGSLPQPDMAGFQAEELPGPPPLLLHTNSFILTTAVASEVSEWSSVVLRGYGVEAHGVHIGHDTITSPTTVNCSLISSLMRPPNVRCLSAGPGPVVVEPLLPREQNRRRGPQTGRCGKQNLSVSAIWLAPTPGGTKGGVWEVQAAVGLIGGAEEGAEPPPHPQDKDLRISFCTQTAVDTLGSMRQTNQEATARNSQGSLDLEANAKFLGTPPNQKDSLKVEPSVKESHGDNIIQLKDCDNKGQSARNPLHTKQLVSTVTITLPESDHLTEVKHKAMKMLKNKDRACSVANLTNQLSNAQPCKEQSWRNRKSKSHPRNTNAPAPSKANSRRPPDVIVSGKGAVKLGVYTTNAEKVSKKRSPLPLLHDAPVEALRENVKHTSADKQNSTKSESTGQKQLVQQEIRSTWQPKRAAVAENLRAKSAVEYIAYTDMFQEINGRDEGPAIYEMFATPVYTNLRLSTMYEKVHNREIKSAPARKNHVRRSSKCPKPLEKKQNKTQGVKVKNRAGVLPKGKSRRLLVRDVEQENVVLVNRPIQLSKAEMVFEGKNGESEGQLILDQRVEDSNLYVIEENLSDQQSETAALHNTPMDRTSPSSREVLPKPLLELPVSSSQSVEENAITTLEEQHTTPQPLQCNTPKGESSETKYNNTEKEAANPAHELRSRSFPTEAKISSWTSKDCGQILSAAFQKFPDGGGEGVVTDDLLQCLAKELMSLEDEDLTLQPENSSLCKGVSDDAAQVKTDQPLTEVYCGLTSKGQLIAVKQVALDDCDPASAESEYQRLQVEVDLLKTLCHDNIVGFLGTALQDGVVSIFMEYVPGGSITSILQRFGPLPEKVLALYTRQILEGVAYLHRNRVIHRDLKGNNIMLMPDGVIKLIDFGCARRIGRLTYSSDLSDLLKSVHGTPYWMAPEVINETGHGRKSDIWSIGCTVFEMATGKPPLAHMDKLAALFYIGARRGLMPTLPEEFSGEAKNFVQSCLTSDQKERPSAEELLKHPFVPQRARERQSAADLARHPGAPSVTASRGFQGNNRKGPYR